MIVYSQLDTWSPPCPVCASTQFEPLAWNDRYGMGVSTAGCLQCGLAQSWPRPTPAAMAEFYRCHYREYYQATSKPDIAYTMRYRKDARLAYTARVITDNVTLTKGMRVLDVGCAEGSLFAKLGLSCSGLRLVGIEPSENFSAYARQTTGCTTYPDLDALVAGSEESFELIVVNHVLEHVDDPVELLRRLMAMLVVGGKLYVDVPDADRYAGPESLHIAHLFHFSPRTLPATLERAGCWVLSTQCHAPPHHPPSVWCLVERRDIASRTIAPDVEQERSVWGRIRRINRGMPLYLFRVRLGRNRFAASFVRFARALFRRAIA